MKILRYQSDIPRNIVWNFKNKCKFFELNESNIINFLMVKFINGDFDEELKLPKD